MKKLSEYNKKRNFNKTNEPSGKVMKKKLKKRVFVVQHHLARKDHYDLRLEKNGVLVSFAIPKGPSYDPTIKRLAIHVEDHPLSYRHFEGTIPKNEYGGGVVMLFDEGYYEPLTKMDFTKPIKFRLAGKRLQGIWNLVPFKDDNYLLIKEDDKIVLFDDIKKINTGIRSGKTMEEIENKVVLTNPDKIIYPKEKITKKEIYDYYQLVAPRMLPYISNRLISTIRCPSGINKDHFYKKHFENINHFLGVKYLKNNLGKKSDFYYIKDITGLLSEVQMNSYEFHIWGSKVEHINKPDLMVFDFDPDKGLSLNNLRQGVKDLKKVLDDLKLKAYLKTSGKKGYHVVCLVNSKNWIEHKKIAHNIAKVLEQSYPDLYTTNMRFKNREKKIYIDWVRNAKSATFVAPYSLRVSDKARVSMPLKWSELDTIKPNDITIEMAIKRLKRVDPWASLFDV